MVDAKLKVDESASSSGRKPLVRGRLRTSRSAITEQGRLAESGLPGLCGIDVTDEASLEERAILACVAIRDASIGTMEWARAVLEACSIADEANRGTAEGDGR